MKKITLSIVSLSIASAVSAQTNTDQVIGKTLQTPIIKSGIKAPEVVSEKAILWGPNSFSTPSEWSFTDNAASGDNWVIGTGVPSGAFAIDGITSTTAADGFALYDSDLMCSGNQNADVYFNTPIDLSANTAVAVEFESFYRQYQGNCYVIASTDGVTWTEIPVHDDLSVNASSPNPDIVTANVSAVVGGSSTAYIGFRYIGGCDYAWMVDDVSIVTLPDNDIGLIRGWHGDILNDWEYSMTPLTQVREMIAGVFVENQGGLDQTFDLTCDVYDASGIVSTSMQTITLAVSDDDTIWFNTGFTPSANGDYWAEFSIPADQDPSDDTYMTSTLNVNDNLMAHDYGAVGSYGWNPAAADPTNAQAPHSWGNIYYPEVDQQIWGVDVNFATGTTPDLYVTVRVQEMDASGSIQGTLTFNNETGHTIAQSEVGSAITTIIFPSPSLLEAGKGYMVDVYKVDGTSGSEELRLGGSDSSTEDDDFSTFGYGPYGTGGAVNYYNSWEFAPYIRANFDASLAVETIALEGVSVYPNPSEGLITISNANNEKNTIVISNATGKVVYNQLVSMDTSIDLSSFGSGLYVVNVSNENGSHIEKVVIK